MSTLTTSGAAGVPSIQSQRMPGRGQGLVGIAAGGEAAPIEGSGIMAEPPGQHGSGGLGGVVPARPEARFHRLGRRFEPQPGERHACLLGQRGEGRALLGPQREGVEDGAIPRGQRGGGLVADRLVNPASRSERVLPSAIAAVAAAPPRAGRRSAWA